MKVVISEKQLARLIGKRKDIDEASTSDANTPTSSDASASTGTGAKTGGESSGPEGRGQMDFPPYPEVDKAEDLVKRGVANPVDSKKKHEDYPEANPVRGRANPIKGM